ncbi:MAG: phosphatidylglycerophosphatase A [Rhodobacteraceae bacterium]|jgi:phosphatidylglycerophosphatase A|nr:phosphatidylglycerophosphatase A [Alphaproteobacteria bacterium]MBT8474619.1 phosphatidylglycerophosphatase A [Alphaproteobacteria bacterium]NNF71196.1 phosphatidylglycerophosphatase A [Paracoccaceae bacterium]NNK66644.1 phosphatidylglycerophosphatase A [Paracoccaceae bacterium]
MSRLIATWFYVGYLRPASGTWGSAAALPFGFVLHGLGGFTALAIATIALFAIGTWATAAHMEATGGDDPSEVVVDEVVGQWVALWPLSIGLAQAGVDPWVFPWPGWVAAFFLFRFFDIFKLGPAAWADRRHDALGVMLDDVFAGIYAGVAVALGAALAHGVLGV